MVIFFLPSSLFKSLWLWKSAITKMFYKAYKAHVPQKTSNDEKPTVKCIRNESVLVLFLSTQIQNKKRKITRSPIYLWIYINRHICKYFEIIKDTACHAKVYEMPHQHVLSQVSNIKISPHINIIFIMRRNACVASYATTSKIHNEKKLTKWKIYAALSHNTNARNFHFYWNEKHSPIACNPTTNANDRQFWTILGGTWMIFVAPKPLWTIAS